MSKIVVANWKQNKNLGDSLLWLNSFEHLILEDFNAVKGLTVIICPSHPFILAVSEFCKKYEWLFCGAQDISDYENGSHTGEVGAAQISDLVDFAIIGHSERKETISIVQKKMDMAFSAGLTPIICFVDPNSLETLKKDNAIYLWEDPGNISKGEVFNPKSVEEIEEQVKEIKETYGIEKGLIYGGSINRQNAFELGNIAQLDGGISGGASLDPQHFFEIVKAFNK